MSMAFDSDQVASSCRFKTVTTLDSDEHAAALQAWDQTYNQLSPGAFKGALQQIWMGNIHVFRETTNRAVSQSGLPTRDCFVFGVPLEMSDTALFGNQVVVPDSFFMFRATDGFSLRTPEFFDVMCIAIPESDMAAALGRQLEGEMRILLSGAPMVFMPPRAALAEFQRCLISLFDPGCLQPNQLADAAYWRSLSDGVVGHLVNLLQTALRAPPPTPSFPGRCRVVEEAVAFALSQGAEPVTVSELCARTRVSRRMLNYCFQDVLNTNPVHYLKAIRLNGVRRELRQVDPAPGVIRDIAGRWGFWHFSRFASEYRLLFGELPSDTLCKGYVSPT